MNKADQNSVTAPGTDASLSASQCLFELESLERLRCAEAEAEPSPNLEVPKQRAKRRTKSEMAQARDDTSLFAPNATPTSTCSEHAQDRTVAATLLAPHATIHRVSIVSTKKQRIRGLQPITTAAETVSASVNKLLAVLTDPTYRYIEANEVKGLVDHQLSRVGRSELRRRTGLDRTTLRRAIKVLIKRHLIVIYEKSEAYHHQTAIYQLCDPDAAVERMLREDGLSGWRQQGRGRVVVSAEKTS
jgi:hypothetical protein